LLDICLCFWFWMLPGGFFGFCWVVLVVFVRVDVHKFYIILVGYVCVGLYSDSRIRKDYTIMPCSVISKSGFIGTAQLFKLRLRAVRAGVWFRALPRIDRVLVDLTIRVARRVRSAALAENLLSVARKLEGLLEGKVSRAIREVGYPLACRLGLIAQSWGHEGAEAWGSDEGFARYLAAMSINEHGLFRG
jgi:hypothetical protein